MRWTLRGPALGLASAALLLAPALGQSQTETVPLDLTSAAARRRLPFDVPFVLEGEAPPGTFRVTLRVWAGPRPAAATPAATDGVPVAVSGTDRGGLFRLAVPALAADRDVRFELALERSLSDTGRRLFRQDVEALLRRQLASGSSDPGPDGAEKLRDGLRLAFERALAEGRGEGAARGEVTFVAFSPLFDPRAPREAADDGVARLTRESRAAGSQLDAALRRHAEAAPSFIAALSEIGRTGDVAALLAALEARPDLDPRNPRSPLALSEEARYVSKGSEPRLEPALAGGPAEVAAAREAHRRNAQALRELRDWTQALVVSGGPQRHYVDELVAAGALMAAQAQALAGLASLGAMRRAEDWARVLEDYAAEAERAQAAADRALVAMVADVEAEAVATVVSERVTATGTTAAGLYTSLDLGLLYGFEVDRGALYAGVNVYLAPVNKDAPLRGAGLRKRLSITAGLTLTNMKQEDDDRFENLIGERWNVLLGLGLRVTRSLRVGAGALLLLKNDPNPLVNDSSLGAVPYVSLSLDLDVGRLVGGGGR